MPLYEFNVYGHSCPYRFMAADDDAAIRHAYWALGVHDGDADSPELVEGVLSEVTRDEHGEEVVLQVADVRRWTSE